MTNENESIHETPVEKIPQSVGVQPISAEFKAKQDSVNAIAKDLLTKFPKNAQGKTPPEIGQVVTAAAWAIERGELKKEDIAEITDINELSARVESSKPTVEKKVSPELYAAQQSVNAISKEKTLYLQKILQNAWMSTEPERNSHIHHASPVL